MKHWNYTGGFRTLPVKMHDMPYSIPIGIVCYDLKPVFTVVEDGKPHATYERAQAIINFLNKHNITLDDSDALSGFLGEAMPESVMCGGI